MEAWLFLGLFGLKSGEGKRLRTSATCHLKAKTWKLKTMRNTEVHSGDETTSNLGQHVSFVVKATDSGPDNRVFNNWGGRGVAVFGVRVKVRVRLTTADSNRNKR